MGRIKTKQIKRVTFELIKDHKNEFSKIFDKNKEIIAKFIDIPSKKLRNTIAGYITRIVNKKEI